MKKIIFRMTLFLLILEICFIINSTIIYTGVHEVRLFVVLCLQFSYGWYQILIKKAYMKHRKIRIVILAVITIGIPITLILTQPEFTYEEGKDLIIKDYSELENIKFTKYDFRRNTIPVSNDSESVFIRNRYYYYSINIGESDLHFFVSPTSGKMLEIEEWHWPDE